MSIVPSSTDDDAVNALQYHFIKHLDECNGTQYCLDHFGLDQVEDFSLLKSYLNNCSSNTNSFIFRQTRRHTLIAMVEKVLPGIYEKADEMAQGIIDDLRKEERVRLPYLSYVNCFFSSLFSLIVNILI
jgi:hypothetical protein